MSRLLTTLIWIALFGSRVLCDNIVRKVKWPHVLIFSCNWNSLVSHGIWFQFVTLICRDCELILPSCVRFVNQSFKLCWSDICGKSQLHCRLAPVPGFHLFWSLFRAHVSAMRKSMVWETCISGMCTRNKWIGSKMSFCFIVRDSEVKTWQHH